MPVVLYEHVGLPRPVVLELERELPRDRGGSAQQEVREAVWRRAGGGCRPGELACPVLDLIVVLLAPDHAGSKLDVVRAADPRERTLLLEIVVDFVNRNGRTIA